jgi:peptidyl-prolyl cis-trans isomerase A (cyclophilin A)
MNLGTVEIELYGGAGFSPLGVANFLSYVDDGSYDDSMIHRTRDNTTVANSDLFAQGGSFKSNGASITPKAAVVNEFNAVNGLSNVAYTLAAARGQTLNSATSGWFINQENNTPFDAGPYTVLGKVTKGTDIIDLLPYANNLPLLKGSAWETMPIINNAEVLITKATRIPILAGDYNNSGSVTAADYTFWKANFGSTTAYAADGNGDGVVNLGDYLVWRNAMAPAAGAGDLGAATVPEPSALFFAFCGGCALLTRRRRAVA